jgi:predicted ATPase
MILHGIELKNFRSIGAEPVILNPLQKCNILVGQNNAGKSNVLRAVKVLLDRCRGGGGQQQLQELDYYKRSKENLFISRLWLKAGSSEKEQELSKIMNSNTFWFDITCSSGNNISVTDHVFLTIINDIPKCESILALLTDTHWIGSVTQEMIKKTFLDLGYDIFMSCSPLIPSIYIIPEFRQIRPGEKYDHNGQHIVESLARWQAPDIGNDGDQRKFLQIQKCVRLLLHLPKATLEIPHSAPSIIINNDGLRLPLTSYGTGVHQLIILVTAVLSIQDSICCIEEPEIHLHPRLQREFIDFLVENTSNQYLISTHSAALINLTNKDVQVFHLSLKNGATVGLPVFQNSESLIALRDLGIKASDLMQANCVIWVEGPSDRIYLQRWMELAGNELVEGRDYVFMCYRELTRLSFERNAVSEKHINVFHLNQNAIIVMDSDKGSDGDELSSDKQKMKRGCEENGGLCWVTDGREIENYLTIRSVARACKDLRGCECEAALSFGSYEKLDIVIDRALKDKGVKPILYSDCKTDYARKFAECFTSDDYKENLKLQVDKIVSKIQEWRT